MATNSADPPPVEGVEEQTPDTSGATDTDVGSGNLVAFAVTMVVVLATLALVPIGLASMAQAIWGQEQVQVYDLFTGTEVNAGKTFEPDAAYVNLTATDLDEGSRVMTLTFSGHRVCSKACPPVTNTFYSLRSDAALRSGLPPSAVVIVPGESGPFTFSFELPVRGTPQRYPFDDYTLLLGLTLSQPDPAGTPALLNAADVAQNRISLTIEGQVAHLNMSPPVPVDPETVRAPSDPLTFLLVDRLQWFRPLYLRILSVLLVVLISASGVFALGTRSLSDLAIGIGGIILGIWGVRSVVVQTRIPDVTLIDLVLGFVILMMLLVLAMRAARHFYNPSWIKRQ